MTKEIHAQYIIQLADSDLADPWSKVADGRSTRATPLYGDSIFHMSAIKCWQARNTLTQLPRSQLLQPIHLASFKQTVEIGSLPYFVKEVRCLP